MTIPAQAERQALCDEFERVGPDAPTLDEGWTTRDLAAHLVVRERRPDAAVGIFGGPLARRLERVQSEVGAKPWSEVVGLVRSGPPRWSPMALAPVDAATNTVEFFVHHEDVRRAQPGWAPRTLDGELEAALWRSLSRTGRMVARRAPVPFDVTTPDGRRLTMKRGEAPLTVSGPVGELVMFVNGRQSESRVDVIGPDDRVAALRTARLGF